MRAFFVAVAGIAACCITVKAEVIFWVATGKTNHDIGLILNMSPRTVNKHLEHIYIKLGVETRTAAANKIIHTEN